MKTLPFRVINSEILSRVRMNDYFGFSVHGVALLIMTCKRAAIPLWIVVNLGGNKCSSYKVGR